MKRPKITMEELIAREGHWLGGVRPVGLTVDTLRNAFDYFDFGPWERSAHRMEKRILKAWRRKNPVLAGLPVLRRDDPRVHLPPERP
jgi:hypothetical protein